MWCTHKDCWELLAIKCLIESNQIELEKFQGKTGSRENVSKLEKRNHTCGYWLHQDHLPFVGHAASLQRQALLVADTAHVKTSSIRHERNIAFGFLEATLKNALLNVVCVRNLFVLRGRSIACGQFAQNSHFEKVFRAIENGKVAKMRR